MVFWIAQEGVKDLSDCVSLAMQMIGGCRFENSGNWKTEVSGFVIAVGVTEKKEIIECLL
jgi:hypothetical protein